MVQNDVRIAIIGATGLVGQKILTVLWERGYNLDQVSLAASERSAGNTITVKDRQFTIREIEAILNQKPDVALFSAGGEVSAGWAEEFRKAGITVIDNSSAFRMDAGVPLIIPEINGHILSQNDKLIANPNCSTIQLLMALAPLDKAFGLKRVNVSTYQSVTGSGQKAVKQLEQERAGETPETMAYPWQIDLNCLPQCDDFQEDGYTKEERKVINETRKILDQSNLPITATAVRVPVMGGHAESVHLSLHHSATHEAILAQLDQMEGVKIQDNPDSYQYPMPRYAQHQDEVFIGRIREDQTLPDSWHLWIVSDNLRKGAATNAVQILDFLIQRVWS